MYPAGHIGEKKNPENERLIIRYQLKGMKLKLCVYYNIQSLNFYAFCLQQEREISDLIFLQVVKYLPHLPLFGG